MSVIDSLDIELRADATKAINSIDKLSKKLNSLSVAMNSIGNPQVLSQVGQGVNDLARGMSAMSGIRLPDFTRLAKGLERIGAVNQSTIASTAVSMRQLASAMVGLPDLSSQSQSIAVFASSISKFGNIRVGNASTQLPILANALSQFVSTIGLVNTSATNTQAISDIVVAVGQFGNAKIKKAAANMPLLATAIRQMFASLANAPQINSSVIQMTNALANLANNGARVGSSTRAMNNALNTVPKSANRATASFKGLAFYIGKMYANFFLVMRGIKAIWRSIGSSMNYVETFNYFTVSMSKLGVDMAKRMGENGQESADNYAEQFASRLNELTRKMTGFSVGNSGELTDIGNVGLGLDANQLMNYQARLSAVTNSVGLLGDTSIATTKAMSMLSADLSSLTNTDLESVMTNLSSGIIGQSRALYKFGIDITNTTLQQYAYTYGIEKSVSAMTQAEKMQLRVLAILEQSKVAWGDQANTINSVANQYRVFQQQVKNLGRTLGNLFLPIVKTALPVVNGLVIALNRLFTSLGFNLWGDSWLKDLQDGISGGVQADIEDLTDGLDDAADSAKELKRQILGFDEINQLSSNQSGSSGTGGGTIDLSDYINDAVSNYESVWNKAFADMTNSANEWADKFGTAFKNVGDYFKPVTDVIAKIDFEKLSKNIGKLHDALAPFRKGFADGFIAVFTGLAQIGSFTIEAISTALGFFGDMVGGIDPYILELIGKGVGVLVGAFGEFLLIAGIAAIIAKIGAAIQGLIVLMMAHPYMAIAAGITALIGAFLGFSRAAEVSEDIQRISKNIDNSVTTFKNALQSIEDQYENLDIFADKYFTLNERFESLSDSEKELFKYYAEELVKRMPELADKIGDGTEAFKGQKEEVYNLIKAQKELARVEAAKDYLKEAYGQELAARKAMTEANKKYNEAMDGYSDYDKFNWTWAPFSKPDFVKQAEADREAAISAWKLASANVENAENIITDYNYKLYEVDKTQNDTANSAKEMSNEVVNSSNKIKTTANDTANTVKNTVNNSMDNVQNKVNSVSSNMSFQGWNSANKYSTGFQSGINNLPGNFNNTLYNMVDNGNNIMSRNGANNADSYVNNFKARLSFGNLPEVAGTDFGGRFAYATQSAIERGADAIRDSISNALSGEFVGEILSTHKNTGESSLTLGFKNYMRGFADGGFPDVGELYIAREAGPELVGTMNGRNAVANNSQIIEGIEQGVYNAMMSVMSSQNNNGNINVSVNIDGKAVFSAVQTQANNYERRTGRPAFA